MIKKIGVIGAGTMGSGIALVCAQHGFTTLLFDVNQQALDKASADISNNLKLLVDKQKISGEESNYIFQRLSFVTDLQDCVADLFIEAIVERLETKRDLFNQLASVDRNLRT